MMKSKYIQTLVLVFGIALLAGLGVLWYEHNEATELAPLGQLERMTLSGNIVCLPHKDTTGPQTLECAFGLQTEEGTYYALDFGSMSQPAPTLKGNEHITANGIFVPIETLSADHWQKYDIEGIFAVTDSFQIQGE